MIEIFEACQTKSIAKQTNEDVSLFIRSIDKTVFTFIYGLLCFHSLGQSCLFIIFLARILDESTDFWPFFFSSFLYKSWSEIVLNFFSSFFPFSISHGRKSYWSSFLFTFPILALFISSFLPLYLFSFFPLFSSPINKLWRTLWAWMKICCYSHEKLLKTLLSLGQLLDCCAFFF